MFKKFFAIILLLILVATPVFLTGCINNGGIPRTDGGGNNGGGNNGGGNNGGGNNGGGNNGGGNEDPGDIRDYFDGVKVTYAPDLSGNLQNSPDNNNNGVGDKQDYINDIKEQIEQMSTELIVHLMAHYGLGVEANETSPYKHLYPTSFEPFDSDEVTYGSTYAHTHKDAVRKDVYYIDTSDPSNPIIYSAAWEWTIDDTGYNPNPYISEYDSLHSQNLRLAIYMIKLNKTVYNIGSSDYYEYINILGQTRSQKNQLMESYAKQIDYVGMLKEEVQKLEQFVLNVMIGKDLVEDDTRAPKIIDNNYNGLFDAEEFIDENSNGQYDLGEKFNDLNNNGVWDRGTPAGQSYDVKQNYFKNYRNTVKSILDKMYDNTGTPKYPIIAGVEFRDFNIDDVEAYAGEEEGRYFQMPLGAQQYKSIIFMNKVPLSFNSFIMLFESTRTFDLEISARYHKVGQGVLLDKTLTTLRINAGPYDGEANPNDFEIDIVGLLAENGVTNFNLNTFKNNSESFDTSIMLNSKAPQANYFKVEKAQNGVSNSTKYIDPSTDFFEIVFNPVKLSADQNQNPISFKFALFLMDYVLQD